MAHKTFVFDSPTKIIYGAGVVDTIGDEVKNFNAKKAMIVTDKGIIKAGLLEKIKESLHASGLQLLIFDEVEPNPKDINVEKGAALATKEKVDLLIGVGGGSSMDTAKGIGLLVTNGGSIRDYWGLDTVSKPALPIITVPTTAGTGSEVTFWAVIDDTSKDPTVKESVGSRLICPRLALVDPLLTLGLPSALTASTGMDALTHAIEAYTATLATPFSDALAMESIRLIADNLRKAYADGNDVDARDGMMLGSLMAGVAFFNSDIAGVHCMAEAIGGLYDTPHGIACAIFLPYVMEYSLIGNLERYADIAEAMGENIDDMSLRDAAIMSVKAVMTLMDDIGIPSPQEVGVKKEDIVQLSRISSGNVSVESNPRKLLEEDFVKIFKKSML